MSETREPGDAATAARRMCRYVPLMVCAACVFAYRWLSFTDFSNDHYVHLSGAQQLSFGHWPVRDFVEPGLPLMRLVSWAGQIVLGEGLQAELILVSVAFAVAAVCSALTAVRMGVGWGVALAVTVAQVVVYPVSYSYPKLLVHAVGIWMLARVFDAPSSPWRAAGLGLWIGIAFLFRHDHGILLAATVLVAWVVGRRLRLAIPARPMLSFAAGVLALVGPYLAYVQWHQGLGRFVTDSRSFSSRERERTQLATPVLETDPGPIVAWRTVSSGGPMIKVRWTSDTGAVERRPVEIRLGLVQQGQPEDGRTVSYRLADWSTDTLVPL